MSYDGQVLVGINTNAKLVPDAATIIRHFHLEFDELRELAGLTNS